MLTSYDFGGDIDALAHSDIIRQATVPWWHFGVPQETAAKSATTARVVPDTLRHVPLEWFMLFYVCGAGGAGKSACLGALRELEPEVSWWEFDDVGVPEHPDKRWRQRAMETWVRRALAKQETGRDSGLCGQGSYGELLAAPSAHLLDGVVACLLDVRDVERVDRLRSRGSSEAASQEMLNWAAWNRMHAVDPQWRQDVIMDGGEPDMRWERWRDWQRGDPRWCVTTLDTTDSSIDQVAQRLRDWRRGKPPADE
ncbi:MAG: hypothetical protein WD314_14140 [Trueperaceae bacterium]